MICNKCKNKINRPAPMNGGYATIHCKKDIPLYKDSKAEHFGNYLDIQSCKLFEKLAIWTVTHNQIDYDVGVSFKGTQLYNNGRHITEFMHDELSVKEAKEALSKSDEFEIIDTDEGKKYYFKKSIYCEAILLEGWLDE